MSDYDNAMSAGPQEALKRQVNAFRAGRALSAPAAAGSAQSTETTEPVANGPAWDTVQRRVEAMPENAQALAARQAEILMVAGQGLAARPYAERKQILNHMAPHLAALGVDGAAGFDPTDANLARAVGEAMILKGILGATPGGAKAAETLPGLAGEMPGGAQTDPNAVRPAPEPLESAS